VQELESIRVSQTISYLPELQCSSKNIVEDNCFDIYKLNAFLEMKNNETNFNQTYYPFFYYSNITVQKVYPGTQQSWNIYNKVGKGGSFKTLIPILIYDPTTDKNSFGVLTVQSYNVE
jgi:hypothetical protein